MNASDTRTAAVRLWLEGEWRIGLAAKAGDKACFDLAPPSLRTVLAERHDALPLFDPNAAGWRKGARLAGVVTQETSAKGMLVPESLELRLAPDPAAACLVPGRDYAADLEWGTFGRLAGGAIDPARPVYASYRHGLSRLDSIVRQADGRLAMRAGAPHVAVPQPPVVGAGATRLANVWVPGRLTRLREEHLFPILESAYPEPVAPKSTVAERCLPRSLARLQAGEALRILAWGDSVTDAGYLPDPATERWQAQFVDRLRKRFPKARIDLVTEAWGGRNTSSYFDVPPGQEHNYAESVLARKPDLVVSEFVNDMGLTPELREANYGRCLADFRRIGAEWIILTPHYVRPDWMGLDTEREIDADPRPLVAFLREFASRNGVALADAAARWGRLWRQGIPYTTLFLNAINHPDPRGMALFADSLMELFLEG